jgi:hypothetical protein
MQESRLINITPPHGESDVYHDSLRLGEDGRVARGQDDEARPARRGQDSARGETTHEERLVLQKLPKKLPGRPGRLEDEVGSG